jgi:signal transduction histidine kinase
LLENAAQGAQRGKTLTERMLAFARNQELKQEVIDIPELVRGMTELLQRSLGPSLRIETRFPLILKPVEADANQLEMALLNLAVNARDAMEDGGEIIMSARQESIAAGHRSGLKAGSYVCLSVTDTGEGMDEETLRKAVEPFFTTKGLGKGTGLGLSMVHGFAEQSGGRFILRSEKGKGTTAELWLPAAKASTEAVAATRFVQAAPAKALRPLTVLAADDDALAHEHGGHAQIGHRFWSHSGRKAPKFRREDPVELVITDQAMHK